MEEVIPRGLIGSAIRPSGRNPEAGTNIARSVIAGIKGYAAGRNENPPLS